ncbi:MAG: hypothetical protein ACD_72C00262G0002 [uncultured bacterium]|nr:MAG: hypothetical protein ACD_72C00262G0002 [uncultured bacterium]
MIAIIDYNAGNVASIKYALKKLEEDFVVTSDPKEILRADRVIFPGVGRAGSAMSEIDKRGLLKILKEIKKPFLGICLGMQLLLSFSDEDNVDCLNIIPGRAKKIENGLKVPQIGWNKVAFLQSSPLFLNIESNSYFYFVHSYYCDVGEEVKIGVTDYGLEFGSVVKKDNFFGVQFHPEKSGEIGLMLLRNFCNL